jgi:hypothetical protein
MNPSELTDFATRYAAAWSSQNPDCPAAFYADDGSLSASRRDGRACPFVIKR